MIETDIKKRAFVFQGVGSDIDRALSAFNSVQTSYFYELCEEVSDFSGINLKKYLIDRTSLAGNKKMFAEWILTGLSDCTVFHTCIQNDIIPDFIVGYSLGLNNAIYCSGSIKLEDTVRILKGVIDSITESQSSRLLYDMGVIIGLELQTVKELIVLYSSDEHVKIASENSEYCIVISGIRKEVEKIIYHAEKEGAMKVRLLNVPCAFHSSLLADYSLYYDNAVENITYCDSAISVVSVYDQKIMTDGNDILNEQKRNFLNGMRWKTTIEFLEKTGVTEFWDMSAKGSVKKTTVLSNPRSSFNTLKTLLKLISV